MKSFTRYFIVFLVFGLMLQSFTLTVAAQTAVKPETSETDITPTGEKSDKEFLQHTTYPYGWTLERTLGINRQPYLPDEEGERYLNTPYQLRMDEEGRVLVVENNGARILGFAPATDPTQPGEEFFVHTDQLHNLTKLAIRENGERWISLDYDGILILNPDGSFYQHIPNEGQDYFSCLRSIDFSQDGNSIYLSQGCGMNRVQKFDITPGEDIEHPYALSLLDTINPGIPWEPWGTMETSGGSLLLNANYVYHCTEELKGWTCEQLPDSDCTDGLYLAPDDTLYRVSGCRNALLKYDPGTENWDTLITDITSQSGSYPGAVVLDADGNVYISRIGQSDILYYAEDGAGGFLAPTLFAGQTGIPYQTDEQHLNEVHGLTVDQSGSLYVLENTGFRLLKYNPDLSVDWVFGEAGIQGYPDDNEHLNYPTGNPDIDSSGRVYIPDSSSQRIVILNASGAYLGKIYEADQNAPGALQYPVGVAIDSQDNIFVVDRDKNNIKVYDKFRFYLYTIGESYENYPPPADPNYFWQPNSIALADDHTLLVADSANQAIKKCIQSETDETVWNCQVITGGTWPVNYPNSLAVDSAGRIFVTDEWGGGLSVLNPDGTVLSTFFKTGDADGWDYPYGVALGPNGSLFASDSRHSQVIQYSPYTPQTGGISQIGGGPVDTALFGDHYIAMVDGARLNVLDNSTNPPTLIGQTPVLQNSPQSIAVSGNYAYVGFSFQYLGVFDLSDPTQPELIHWFAMEGDANRMQVVGDKLYIASNSLLIYDISDPSYPVIFNRLQLPNHAYTFEVETTDKGTLLYLIERTYADNTPPDAQLWIYDAADPLNFQLLGGVDFPGSGNGITVEGDQVYIAGGYAPTQFYALIVIDASNPADPQILGSNSDFPGEKVAVRNQVAYVINANGNPDIVALNVSDPSNIQTLDTFTPRGYFGYLNWDGSTLLVPDMMYGLHRLSTEDPGDLEELPGYEVDASFTFKLVRQGHILFVTEVGGGLSSFDVSDKLHPQRLDTLDLGASAYEITLDGNLVYVQTDKGLCLVDISDPANLNWVSEYRASGADPMGAAAVQDGIAYLPTTDGVHLVDVSTPESPALITTYQVPDFHPTQLSVEDDLLAVVEERNEDGALQIHLVDISAPESPTYQSNIFIWRGPVSQIALLNDILTVAIYDGETGLEFHDVADPSTPSPITFYSTFQGIYSIEFTVLDDRLLGYLAYNDLGFLVLDVTNLNDIVQLDFLDAPAFARDVTSEGPYVYSAIREAGLTVSWFAPLTETRITTPDAVVETNFDHIRYTFGTSSNDVHIIHTPVAPEWLPTPPDGWQDTGLGWDLRMYSTVTGFSWNGSFQAIIPYDENKLGNMSESQLCLYRWDDALKIWVLIPASVDTTENFIQADLSHGGLYRVMGKGSYGLYLPLINR